ncbi:MAG: RHS repeat-associated core domain-containing protein, partial [Candidatus Micrarchaeota archaeon]
YNYSNGTNYKLTARASNLTFSHQLSLVTNSNFTNATSSFSNLTQSFVYDSNGNTIQDQNNFYEYNSFNQLSKIRIGNSTGAIISEYLYDPDGNRIRKLDKIKNETTFYFSQNFQQTLNSTGRFNTTYYFDGSTMVARKDSDGKKYFYHPDHLGSTTLVTYESGAIIEETNYKPFGEVLTDGKSKYLYTGKEKDSESGLMYYGARYYNPGIGRFVQADSMISNPYDPQSLNRYSYVLNNPYKFVDKKGNFAIVPALLIAGSALAGGYLAYQSTYAATGNSNAALLAGVIGGVASGASAAVVIGGSVVGAVGAGGSAALRYMGFEATLTAGAELFGLGASSEFAIQNIEGKSVDYGKVGIAGSSNLISSMFFGKLPLPLTLARPLGSYFPSTLKTPFMKELFGQFVSEYASYEFEEKTSDLYSKIVNSLSTNMGAPNSGSSGIANSGYASGGCLCSSYSGSSTTPNSASNSGAGTSSGGIFGYYDYYDYGGG